MDELSKETKWLECEKDWFKERIKTYGVESEFYRHCRAAMTAINYRIPQRPIESARMLKCPTCLNGLCYKSAVKEIKRYCPRCGQAIDAEAIKKSMQRM